MLELVKRRIRSLLSATSESLKLYGHLDLASADRVEGWIVAQGRPTRRRRIKITIDGKKIAEMTAGDFRKDLKVGHIGVGDGCYAFFYRPRTALEPGEYIVRVVDAETNYELDGSPKAVWVRGAERGSEVPSAQPVSDSFWALQAQTAHLDGVPTTTVVFEGQSVSLGLLNCNPYEITPFALADSIPTTPLPIQVSINHRQIDSTPELLDAALANGGTARFYRFQVPPKFPIAPGMPVQVLLAGEPLDMPGSRPEIACRFIGALDRCDSRSVSGWVACLDALDRRVAVDIYVGGRFIECTTADRHREDLQKLGIGDGSYGFLAVFPEPVELDPDSDLHVRVLVRGLGHELHYSPWYIARVPRKLHAQELLTPIELPD